MGIASVEQSAHIHAASGSGEVRRTLWPPHARHVREPARDITTATSRSRSLERATVARIASRTSVIELEASMTIVGPRPVKEATGASGPSRTDWRSYTDKHSRSLRDASLAMTSRTRDDFPEPETPVTPVKRFLAKSPPTFCRL